jgi:hypothetical protein
MAHIFIRILGLLAFAFIGVQAANAQANIQPVDGPIEQLKAGEYLWAPQIAPEGPVTMIISVNTQRGYVYRNGVPIGVTSVSTGKKGHETPTGIFTILQKDIDHRSSKYNNAPMPYMQRLTWDGVAMHAGNLPAIPHHTAASVCPMILQNYCSELPNWN